MSAADGTLTISEVAAECKITYSAAEKRLRRLRNRGYDVPVSSGNARREAAKRQAVIKLADGSRSAAEIAAATDANRNWIYSVIAQERAAGRSVSLRRERAPRNRK